MPGAPYHEAVASDYILLNRRFGAGDLRLWGDDADWEVTEGSG